MSQDGTAGTGTAGTARSAEAPKRLESLLEALVCLKTTDEARMLLADLCTPRELEDLSQRLEVARMLDAGVSYTRIQGIAGASATTVARVARCLKYGPGGYRTVLDRLPPYSE